MIREEFGPQARGAEGRGELEGLARAEGGLRLLPVPRGGERPRRPRPGPPQGGGRPPPPPAPARRAGTSAWPTGSGRSAGRTCARSRWSRWAIRPRASPNEAQERGDYTRGLFLHGLAVEAAEALAEHWHRVVRRELGVPDGQGKRYSPGYPSWPELEDQRQLWKLLDPERTIGVALTEAEPDGPRAVDLRDRPAPPGRHLLYHSLTGGPRPAPDGAGLGTPEPPGARSGAGSSACPCARGTARRGRRPAPDGAGLGTPRTPRRSLRGRLIRLPLRSGHGAEGDVALRLTARGSGPPEPPGARSGAGSSACPCARGTARRGRAPAPSGATLTMGTGPRRSPSFARPPRARCASIPPTGGGRGHGAPGTEGHRDGRRPGDGRPLRAAARRGGRAGRRWRRERGGARRAPAGDPPPPARRRRRGGREGVRRVGGRRPGRPQRPREQRRDHPGRPPREEGPGHRRGHHAVAARLGCRHRREPHRGDAHGPGDGRGDGPRRHAAGRGGEHLLHRPPREPRAVELRLGEGGPRREHRDLGAGVRRVRHPRRRRSRRE